MTTKIQEENHKVAIIIGASSGIGQSAAIELAKRGVGIIFTYYSREEGADKTVADIEELGQKAIALPLDANRSDGFDAFKNRVAVELKKHWQQETFTYLVNNAGYGQAAMFEDTTEEQFDRLTNVLLKAPYFITQKLLPLLQDGGAIVNVASNSALPTVVSEGYSAYASAKGGLIVLTRYMAKELSRRGIRVNSVAPGPTVTGMFDGAFEKYPELIQSLIHQTALNRLGLPEDIGQAIASLLSEEWKWITGQNIEISGGFNL